MPRSTTTVPPPPPRPPRDTLLLALLLAVDEKRRLPLPLGSQCRALLHETGLTDKHCETLDVVGRRVLELLLGDQVGEPCPDQ